MSNYSELILKSHFDNLRDQLVKDTVSSHEILIETYKILQVSLEHLPEDKRIQAQAVMHQIREKVNLPGPVLSSKPMRKAGMKTKSVGKRKSN